MKTLGRLVTSILFLVFAAFAVFVLFRNVILKTGIERAVTTLTGFRTEVQDLNYDFPSVIQIKGLKIHNPAGFENDVFADVPEIFVSLNLGRLLKEKTIHLPEIRLNVQAIHIEKNKDGRTNAELLSSVGKKEGQAAPSGKPAEPAQAMPFILDRFELTLREVRYEDPNSIVPTKLGVDMKVDREIFTNIDNPQALVNLILVKIVKGTTFGNLMGLNPETLVKGTLKNTLATGENILKDASSTIGGLGAKPADLANQTAGAAAESVEALGEKVSGVLGGSLKEGQSVLSDTAGAAQKKLSGVFGKLKSTVQSAAEETPSAETSRTQIQ